VILFLPADPARTSLRALDEECAAIERELALTPGRDDVAFRSKWEITVDGLMRHLLDLQPAIVHFSGAGSPAGLVLEGDDGRPHPVAPAALTHMIRAAAGTAQVAVLNACYIDAQADALRDAIGCALGIRGTAGDAAARAFAVGFYRALGHRLSIGQAYDHAVATLAGKDLLSDADPRCLARPGVEVDALRLGAGRALRAPPRAAPRRRSSQPPLAAAPAASAGAPSPSDAGPPSDARYDLFLAHPSVNKPSAHALYDLLQPDVRVFLDARSLAPGERWDQQIPAAQRASRATVILISSRADRAWYLGDEIVTAIALHRAAPAAHALIPVLLEPGAALPYGLAQIQAIDATAEGGLTGVARRLREVAARLHLQPAC
jgi:hypothetical protein